jgi:spore germination protein GerM
VKRPPLRPTVVLGLVLLLVIWAAVRLSSSPSTEPVPDGPEQTQDEAEAGIEVVAADESPKAALRRLNVLIYFPGSEGDGLVGEAREIFNTTAPGDRAKQILADLISGSNEQKNLRAVPPGTQLRQVYILDDGTAYVDFSADLKAGMRGGSTEELLTVYAIINSVALNIPEIRRLGILIDGEPVETLNGHLDLRRPLPPDPSIILRSGQPRIVRKESSNNSAA